MQPRPPSEIALPKCVQVLQAAWGRHVISYRHPETGKILAKGTGMTYGSHKSAAKAAREHVDAISSESVALATAELKDEVKTLRAALRISNERAAEAAVDHEAELETALASNHQAISTLSEKCRTWKVRAIGLILLLALATWF